MDFDFSLPSYVTPSAEFSLLAPGNNPSYQPYSSGSDWWDDTPAKQDTSSIWGDAWNWANTETGTAVLSGALKGVGSMYLANRQAGDAKDINQANNAARLAATNISAEASRAQTDRINQHNKSINLPTKINMRKFKK